MDNLKVQAVPGDEHVRLQAELIDGGRRQGNGNGHQTDDFGVRRGRGTRGGGGGGRRGGLKLLLPPADHLRSEVGDNVHHPISTGLEVLTAPFGQSRLHAHAELPLQGVTRSGHRNGAHSVAVLVVMASAVRFVGGRRGDAARRQRRRGAVVVVMGMMR